MNELGKVNVPYLEDLIRIREILEKTYPRFPARCCDIATRAVHDVVGLDMAWGTYRHAEHFWNFDKKRGLYVDLSMDQFAVEGRSSTPIVIAPPEALRELQLKEIGDVRRPLMPYVASQLRAAFPAASIPEYRYQDLQSA